jgi:type III restriction enzyme
MSKVKIKFEDNQEHQLKAIDSVVKLFDGYSKRDTDFRMFSSDTIANVDPFEMLDEQWLFDNMLKVQKQNDLVEDMYLNFDDGFELVDINAWRYPYFTIEMETGTGKTYVYLRTIHELRKQYGWSKFIIIVPSVAIYEGFVNTFENSRQHFSTLYNNETVALTQYAGEYISKLRGYASSSTIEIMVMTIDAFNKSTNVIYKATEKLQGEKLPYQYIQETRPILILDESQNYTSDTSRKALRTLHPLFAIKYSATPDEKGATKEINRELMNRIYNLTPVDAFRLNLVKKIEVLGVTEQNNMNDNQLSFMLFEERQGYGLGVEARMNVLKNGELKSEVVKLRKGDNLFSKTGNENYFGMVIDEIDRQNGVVIFTNGVEMKVAAGGDVTLSKEEIFRIQIEEAIRIHMAKQRELLPHGIKVLTLFFIDKVANYVDNDGLIKKLFDEAFEKRKQHFPFYKAWNAEQVREGYFAKKKGKNNTDEFIDTSIENKTQAEKDLEKQAYNLIMKEKGKLLSFDEKVSFIFAHSALREGWDNPNVFQICTLNTSISEKRKRQEIGRGLRLAVNQEGVRVANEGINVLTVIANESYEEYCENLQKDYLDSGDVPPNKPSNASKKPANRRNDIFNGDDFKKFWAKLCRQTEYTIFVDEKTLVENCITKLTYAKYPEPNIVIVKGKFVMTTFSIKLLQVSAKLVLLEINISSSEETRIYRDKWFNVGDDLAKITKDERLKGFKIVDVVSEGDFSEITFSDKGKLRIGEAITFITEKGQKADPQIRQEAQTVYPVMNFIERAAQATSLKKTLLLEIFKGLKPEIKERVFKNPEGFTTVFIERIKSTLADHVADKIEYRISEHLMNYDEDELFPESKKFPQKELVDGAEWSLYDQVQIDSDIERRFVNNKLNEDDKIVCYFKFPSKFKINIPKIIGNYNPDWGIIRRSDDDKFKLELVRETKGNVNPNLLQFPNEKRKIDCAKKHFELVDMDYRQIVGDELNWWKKP